MIVLEDIPRERVAAAVKELLGLDSVQRVVEVTIGIHEVRAEIYSTDEAGHMFLGNDGEIARHIISRRVV